MTTPQKKEEKNHAVKKAKYRNIVIGFSSVRAISNKVDFSEKTKLDIQSICQSVVEAKKECA